MKAKMLKMLAFVLAMIIILCTLSACDEPFFEEGHGAHIQVTNLYNITSSKESDEL